MPLIPNKCPCCGGKLVIDPQTKTSTCPFCNTSHTLEPITNNYTTNISNHFPGANFNLPGPSAEKYIQLAINSLEAGNYHEACDYANKALESQPNSSSAWIIKMKATQSLSPIRDPITKEIKAYGKNAIQCADSTQKSMVKDIVYHHFLARSIILMAAAVAEGQDASELRSLIFANAGSKEDEISEELIFQALSLTNAVPNRHFDSSSDARKQLIRLCNLYIDYYKSCDIEIQLNEPPSSQEENTLASLMDLLTNEEKLLVNGYKPVEKKSLLKEHCYIAVVVYGSYDCPEVWILRRYRDEYLSRTLKGRFMRRIYYSISPTIVKYFGRTKWLYKLSKYYLDRLVVRLKAEGVSSARYRDKE